MLLRDSPPGPEVLLVERNPRQSFMGGAWVFPGGAIHSSDGGGAGAAARELREEAGIELPPGTEIVEWSRWITPADSRIRFDTLFFVAEAPEGAEARADGAECLSARWLRPQEALALGERDELTLVLPTIRHLEALTAFESAAAAVDNARRREVVPLQPK